MVSFGQGITTATTLKALVYFSLKNTLSILPNKKFAAKIRGLEKKSENAMFFDIEKIREIGKTLSKK